jgi:hypothetical protein
LHKQQKEMGQCAHVVLPLQGRTCHQEQFVASCPAGATANWLPCPTQCMSGVHRARDQERGLGLHQPPDLSCCQPGAAAAASWRSMAPQGPGSAQHDSMSSEWHGKRHMGVSGGGPGGCKGPWVAMTLWPNAIPLGLRAGTGAQGWHVGCSCASFQWLPGPHLVSGAPVGPTSQHSCPSKLLLKGLWLPAIKMPGIKSNGQGSAVSWGSGHSAAVMQPLWPWCVVHATTR